jgi:hypothetical protein
VRARTAAYLALLLGGGLALVASSQAWWRAVGTGVSVRFTGSQAGVLVALGAGLVIGTARRWPVRPDRFARAAEPSVTAPSGDPGDVWRAMDAGIDPTVDRPADDPDVRKTGVADTMEQSDGSVRTGLSAPASPPEETEVRNG